MLKFAQREALAHLEAQVPDPKLRDALTPRYTMGCKRVLISNDYYPSLTRPNVELISDPIAEIRSDSIVTQSGTVREIDAIVIATGFHVTDSPALELVKGADGVTMGEHFREAGPQAYKGTAVAGFPNAFVLVGPNTGLGHTSLLVMIEAQLNYLMSALDAMDRHRLATVEVKPGALARYNRRLRRRMGRTVWTTGGCKSWYLDSSGRNTTLWPGFTFAFRALTRRFDLAAYNSTPT